jgi:acetaldehyde dehydrogenase/alcohol dehydrogenase
MKTCVGLNALGGQGHTLSIYANNDRIIKDFTAQVSAGRICVNTPATQGAIGGIYNSLNTSFTLSCGTNAGNIFTDNITTTHLLNIYRVARRRPNMKWFAFSQNDWLDPELDAKEIIVRYNKNY